MDYWAEDAESDGAVCEGKVGSGKLVEFQNYRLVNDTWVKFIKDKNRTRDVLLVKIKDTESMVEEKY